LYPGRRSTFDPALSLKTALTRIRVSELRQDPIRSVPEEQEEP
jgi:hypothetical protein